MYIFIQSQNFGRRFLAASMTVMARCAAFESGINDFKGDIRSCSWNSKWTDRNIKSGIAGIII